MIFRFLSNSRVRERRPDRGALASRFFLINNQTHPILARHSYYIHIPAMGRRVRDRAQLECVCVAEKRKRLFLSLSYISILPTASLSLFFRFKSRTSSFTTSIYRRSSSPFVLLHLTCIYTRRLHRTTTRSLISPIPPFEISRWVIPQLNCGPYCSSPRPARPFLPSHPSDPIYRGPSALLPVISYTSSPFFLLCLGLLSQSAYSVCDAL